MKVIFLDFDGVLNSNASFLYEKRRRNEWKEQGVKGPINQTLCHICASNFQIVLDQYPDVKVVISSTWREMFDLDWLKEKLASYHIDSSRVIDKTPKDWGQNRGLEIQEWLGNHPEVTHYIIIDDNTWGIPEIHGWEKFVKTTWEAGMTFEHALEAIEKLQTPKKERKKKDEKTKTE